MAESTPPSRSVVDDPDEGRRDALRESRRSLRLIDHSVRASQPSHPPSEPRPIPGRPGADTGPDRPARVQLIAALLLLLVLVVVPLYLWRRPRAAAIEEAANATASVAVAPNQVTEPAPEARLHTRDGVTIGDAKIIGCHDRGSKRTSAGACDHVPGLESALSKAVLDAASCAGPSAQGAGAGTGTPAGSIAFVVDASYGRHKSPVHVTSQRDGTTMPPKVVAACLAEVKKSLSGASFDPSHAHARYQIEVDATYAGKR
jgi:hypothetical protein